MRTLFKIIITCAVIFFVIFFLVTCSAFLKKMDIHEIESYSYKEIMTEGGKHARITVADKGDKGENDVILLSLLRENGYDEDTYFIAERQKKFLREEYINERPLFQDGNDLEYFLWQGKHIFAVNDKNCENIRIIVDGEENVVKCGRLPFIYVSTEEPEAYEFLDSGGEVIK